jgi:hypothetical protein
LVLKGSPGNDTDDYLEVNNTTDDEYEEPTNDTIKKYHITL